MVGTSRLSAVNVCMFFSNKCKLVGKESAIAIAAKVIHVDAGLNHKRSMLNLMALAC